MYGTYNHIDYSYLVLDGFIMCIIQTNYFVKNGSSIPGSSCGAYITDKIETDTIVTFDSSEVGKTVKVGVTLLYPDGVEREKWSSSFVVPSVGTYDFIILINVTGFGTGTYVIKGAETWNYIAGTLMCSGNLSGGLCQNLTINPAPCSTPVLNMTIPA